MLPVSDLYACLGVGRTASPEQVRQAYRNAARRFHPDVNSDPQAADEFKIVVSAYEVLNDPGRRAEYDSAFRTAPQPYFSVNITYSRTKLLRLAEPQIVYALVDVRARVDVQMPNPPLNICLVIDRSTSMQGQRLEQVKIAARQIVENLTEHDIFSVVTFSDHAEVVLPAQPIANKNAIYSKIASIYATGGTEILQGLQVGLLELQNHLGPSTISHLVLLTDGRTYGDEDDCMLLAVLAENDGIMFSGLGIGDEWNDAFLDKLTSRTGGQSHYISSPPVVTRLLIDQVRGIGQSLGRMRFQIVTDNGVRIKSAFRVAPEAQALPADNQPITVGKLEKDGNISVLLELVVSTTPDPERPIARLWVIGDILKTAEHGQRLVADLRLEQVDKPDLAPPPTGLVAALDRLTLYRLQEKAWADAEQGNIVQATQRLQTLATRLLANGERELAQVAMSEANRLNQTHQISSENRKRIKYGTRALIAPPKNSP